MTPVRSAAHAAVALLAPGGCRLCESRLTTASDYPVCNACLSEIHAMRAGSTCNHCGEPLDPEMVLHAGQMGIACGECLAAPPKFARAVAFGLYDDLRPAIRLLKFENTPSLARPLGAMLAQAILQLRETSPRSLIVVPVPLFRGKRPYNQSTLLARCALRCVRAADPDWKLTLRTDLLRRIRPTESQFLLSPAQRRDNLRNAFQAHGSAAGLDMLLIDDVYTTGATARECTRVLLLAGATSVRVATLARAGRDIAVRWRPLSTATGSEAGTTQSSFRFAQSAGQQKLQ